MEIAVKRMKHLWHWLRRAGPYLVVMMLLPGGTLLALALLLRQRSQMRIATPTRAAVVVTQLGRYAAPMGERVR